MWYSVRVRNGTGFQCMWWWGSACRVFRGLGAPPTRDMVRPMSTHRSSAASSALAAHTPSSSACRGGWRSWVVFLTLCAALVAPSLPVAADEADQSTLLAAPGGPWQPAELTPKQRFAITYSQREPVAAQVDTYKKIADDAYEMETSIFGATLPQPVPIYLFNDVGQFTTAVSAAQGDTTLYSGIDGGGIYIGVPRMRLLKPNDLTANLRTLLTQQLVATMSGGNFPPGFQRGLALYAAAPPIELPGMVTTLGQQITANTLFDWATMAGGNDPAFAPQQYSVTAFLIDTYGFRSYRTFIGAMQKQKDWRAAIQTAYTNETATTLEAKWRTYLPQFIGGLWQRNQFTYYNTDEANQLYATGQYTQAVTSLTAAIPFLQQIGNPKRAAEAQQLLSKARAGSEAETRLRDAQQALEGNDYERTNALLDQALELYKAVPDAKPPLLVAQYRTRATRGLQATSDLTLAEAQVDTWNVIRARQRASSALGTFAEYGNTPLADRAQVVIQRADGRIKTAGLGIIATGGLILVGGITAANLRRGRHGLPALPPLE